MSDEIPQWMRDLADRITATDAKPFFSLPPHHRRTIWHDLAEQQQADEGSDQ